MLSEQNCRNTDSSTCKEIYCCNTHNNNKIIVEFILICVQFTNTTEIMSSNALTADQPVESIKKFKFYTNRDKEEIEIVIPEVS